jgi:hypothetical protein
MVPSLFCFLCSARSRFLDCVLLKTMKAPGLYTYLNLLVHNLKKGSRIVENLRNVKREARFSTLSRSALPPLGIHNNGPQEPQAAVGIRRRQVEEQLPLHMHTLPHAPGIIKPPRLPAELYFEMEEVCFPTPDANGLEFLKFAEVFGKPASDAHHPSIKAEAGIDAEFLGLFITNFARGFVTCTNCTLPRVVFCRKDLNEDELQAAAIAVEANNYVCGAPLFPPDHTLAKTVVVRPSLTCITKLETHYVARQLGPPVCGNCGETDLAVLCEPSTQLQVAVSPARTCSGALQLISHSHGTRASTNKNVFQTHQRTTVFGQLFLNNQITKRWNSIDPDLRILSYQLFKTKMREKYLYRPTPYRVYSESEETDIIMAVGKIQADILWRKTEK